MKKILTSIIALLFMALNASSMSYEQARREAFFLTDKMAYELNLTPEQYDAAYEINLDYLMGVSTVDDVFSEYWRRRSLDMSYILLQWQWEAFRAATYFYRPLYWADGFWHFAIYSRYPRRNYFYFSRPTVYVTYRGGHSWRSNGGRSYYHAHRDYFRKPASHGGMRDRWNKGEFRGNRTGGKSSTRVTVNQHNKGNSFGLSNRGGTFSSNRLQNAGRKPTASGTFRIGNTNSQQGNVKNSGAAESARKTGTTRKPTSAAANHPSPQQRNNTFGGVRKSGSFNTNTRRTTMPSNVSRPTSPIRARNTGTGNSVRSGSFRQVKGGSATTRSHNSSHGNQNKGGGFSGRR